MLTIIQQENQYNYHTYTRLKYTRLLDNFACELDTEQLKQLKKIWETIVGNNFKNKQDVYKKMASKNTEKDKIIFEDKLDFKYDDNDDDFLNSDDEMNLLKLDFVQQDTDSDDTITNIQTNIVEFYSNPLYILSLSSKHSELY